MSFFLNAGKLKFVRVAGASALLVLLGCAPKVDNTGESSQEETTQTLSGSGEVQTSSTAAGASATSAVTSVTIEWHAEPPPPGVKMPFPDALIATDITPGKRGGNFTYSTFGEPKTFNPITANESSSVDLLFRMFDSLLDYDYSNQIYYPRLLKECYMEADKRNWILRFRDGLKWSDGQPITADDILFTMEVIYDKKVVTPAKDTLQVAGQPIQFEKIDNLTVRAKLAQPSGSFHVMMSSVQIIPKHALEADFRAGKFMSIYNVNVDPAKVVCSGPFKLKNYAPGQRVILERNPYYYKYDRNGTQLPYLDTFTFAITPDSDAMILRFQGGEADGTGSPKPEQVPDLRDRQKQGNYTLYDEGPGAYLSYLWFNMKRGANPKSHRPYTDPFKQELFNNENFRKACYHALNKQAIIDSILRGLAQNVWSNETPALKYWYNPNVQKYEYDPAKAKALLEKEGYKDRNGDGIREDAKGNKLSFSIITNKGNKLREDAAQLLVNDLKAVGIDAQTQFVEFTTLVVMINDSYEYDACYLSFGGSIHPITSMNTWRSNGRTHFFNPLQKEPANAWEAEVDKLCDAFTTELDPFKQQKIYFKMQQIYAEHCANLPLWTSKAFYMARNTFGNIRPSALIEMFWNAEEFYVK
jgi:peptide/nickel transport system substrate-binding protein